jgi:hypothetical protein
MLHDGAVIERAGEIEQIVAVNNSFDARTFAAGLEQLDCVAACQNCHPCCGRSSLKAAKVAYFSWDEIELNVVLSFVPRPFTTAIMATEMPAAIKPYSMAVAADSSRKKALSFASMTKYKAAGDSHPLNSS